MLISKKNVADVFNNYFLTVACDITKKNMNSTTDKTTMSINNDILILCHKPLQKISLHER